MENTIGLSSCLDLRKAFGTSPTSSSYTAKVPVAVEPTLANGSGGTSLTSGVHRICEPGSKIIQSFIGIMPWSTAANNNTFLMRVWGWKVFPILTSATAPYLYVPRLLLDVTCTAGNIAAGLGTNTFFADTIVVSGTTPGDSGALFITPTGDCAGSIKLDIFGSNYIEFDFGTNSSSTAMNALWWLQS